jgi:hypothetical protein
MSTEIFGLFRHREPCQERAADLGYNATGVAIGGTPDGPCQRDMESGLT